MQEVLRTIEKEPYVSSIAFICGHNAAFTLGFQELYKQYSQCMPNLLSAGAFAVINTSFSVRVWNQKHQRFVEDGDIELPTESYGGQVVGKLSKLKSAAASAAAGLVYKKKTAKELYIEKRREAFREKFDVDPVHFYIDSLPSETKSFEQMVSRNCFADIMKFLSTKSGMPTDQMRLCKSPHMKRVDLELAQLLLHLKISWEKEQSTLQAIAQKNGDTMIVARTRISRSIASATREIEDWETQLSKKDNTTEMPLRSKIRTYDDVSWPNRFWKGLTIQRFKGLGIVEETTVPHFFVCTADGQYFKWLSPSTVVHQKLWSCDCEANYGRTPDMEASSYTYNKYWYASEIADLEHRLAEKRPELEANETALAQIDAPDDEGSEQHTKINLLTKDIADVEQMVRELHEDTLALAVGFSAAAQKRYTKDRCYR